MPFIPSSTLTEILQKLDEAKSSEELGLLKGRLAIVRTMVAVFAQRSEEDIAVDAALVRVRECLCHAVAHPADDADTRITLDVSTRSIRSEVGTVVRESSWTTNLPR